ncbi:MAG: hypothetical protein JSR37_00325 [Verrucomicrobia bacterium]|nr:hypothetical protein [Verrucomicrobiota bacterium]
MNSSRDIDGPGREYRLGGEEERPSKRGKSDKDSKTEDVARDVLEEEESTPYEKSPPTRKRLAREETANPPRSPITSKTKKAKERVLPYSSTFLKETEPLVHDVADIASQNALKKVADGLFEKVTNPKIREEISKLALELTPGERLTFLERVEFYVDRSCVSLTFLANVHPKDRLIVMEAMRKFLSTADVGHLHNNLFSRLSKEMPPDFVERLTLMNDLFSEEITTADIGYLILDCIYTLPLDLCHKLKPILQEIKDPRIVSPILHVIQDISTRQKIDPSEMSRLIIATKAYLDAIIKAFESQCTTLDLVSVVGVLFEAITKVPSEKVEAAVRVGHHIADACKNYVPAAMNPTFLSSTTIEQVDCGLSQTTRFYTEFAQSLELEDRDTSSAFIAFTKVPPEEYEEVVKNLAPFLSTEKPLLNGENVGALVYCITNTPPNKRAEIREQIENMAKLLDSKFILQKEKITIYQALLSIPEAKRSTLLKQIDPVLRSPLDCTELTGFLTATDCEVDQDVIADTASFIEKVIQVTRNDKIRLKTFSLLHYVDTIPAHERQDVLTRALATTPLKLKKGSGMAALLIAIEAIPIAERESVTNFAKQIAVGRDYYADEMAEIIRAITRIDPAERPIVVEATVANLEEDSNSDEIVEFIDYYNSYTLEIPQSAIKEQPLQLLAQFAEQISKKRAKRIKVTFEGEKGQDAGGLGRVFISELFEALKTKLAFREREGTGLSAPVASGILSDEAKKAYNHIGKVLMFCLNASTDYPIGMIFEQSVFTALTKLHDKHLANPIQELVKNKELYDEFSALYQEMYSLDESAKSTLEWMQNNKDDPEAKEQIEDMIVDVFGPLVEIAKGMKDVVFNTVTHQDLLKMTPLKLSEKLQGVVGKPMILSALEFHPDISPQIEQWVRSWIKAADNKKLTEFLLAMTGSSALGRKPLKISACEGEKFIFHTCFNSVELPVAFLESEEKLNALLDNVLGGGRFTIA